MEEEVIATLKAGGFLSATRHKTLGIVLSMQLKAFHEGETEAREGKQRM